MCRLNNEQFASLMRQYQRLVYTVCYQFVHDPHTAEDLTRIPSFRPGPNIDRCDPAYHKQWLVRVATNKCKDHLKKRLGPPGCRPSRTTSCPNPAARRPATPKTRRRPLIAREEAGALQNMVRTLREPYGSVATMYLLEHKTVPVIAQALGRPEKTVQNQIFRAKVILRQQILERRQA